MEQLADRLYLAVLSRRPTVEEVAAVTGYLQQEGIDRVAGIRDLAWSLVASPEFRFYR
jgi:hypothetical protein